jgi:fructuronate reductase
VPWEHRKLWLLNGSHSLMAYAATLRGHETVEQAIADPVVRGWVEQWWDDAARHLPLPAEEITAYRAALLERYANPRIRHLLRQIAADGSQKVPIRILPTVRAELADGRVPTGCGARARRVGVPPAGQGAPVADVAAEEFDALAAGELDDAVGRVLARLGVDDRGWHRHHGAGPRAAANTGALLATDCRRDGHHRLIDGRPQRAIPQRGENAMTAAIAQQQEAALRP